MDDYGYRSISANKTYTMQQYNFYYDAEQNSTVYITGEAWINCTFEDDIGTYVKTEYVDIEGEFTNIVHQNHRYVYFMKSKSRHRQHIQ